MEPLRNEWRTQMNAVAELENFTQSETEGLSDELLVKLQAVRYAVGKPMFVTSGYRHGDSGAHGSGAGVDISDNGVGADVGSRWRFLVLRAALAVGFNRIGVYDRHIHLDVSKEHDQEVVWWGTSD